MPNTYTELDRITVGTAVASVTFSSISSAYTDLVLVINGLGIASDSLGVTMTFNGVTTNRSYTRLQGDGSTASSFRSTNDPAIGVLGNSEGGNLIAHIMNYSNTTTFKTILTRYNSLDAGDGRVGSYVSLWGSTAAITSMVLGFTSGNIAVGTTFSLYGIANADLGAAKATGGIITEDSQYWYHTFGASGTFTPKQALTADVLVVAGGGGGGGCSPGAGVGGGGGAGGFRTGNSLSIGTSLTVTVGAGGTGGANFTTAPTNGSDSIFSTITSSGGGRGGYGTLNGAAGGSGGGGEGSYNGGAGNTPSTSPSQGNNGGNGTATAPNYPGGGGGGAGAIGGNGSGGTIGGVGGNGTASSISGSSVTYAGGGGAGTYNGGTPGAGGSGGGGAGRNAAIGGAGTVNLGGGGGGTGGTPSLGFAGGAGGSGIVIVRYAKV